MAGELLSSSNTSLHAPTAHVQQKQLVQQLARSIGALQLSRQGLNIHLADLGDERSAAGEAASLRPEPGQPDLAEIRWKEVARLLNHRSSTPPKLECLAY